MPKSHAERSIKKNVIRDALVISNETITEENMNDPDLVHLDLSEMSQKLLTKALPFFSQSPDAFALIFHPVRQEFGHFTRESFQELVKEMYRDRGFIIGDENIFKLGTTERLESAPEGSGVKKSYWLGVMQPQTPMEIRNASVCILSLCVGIEVSGVGVLFKSESDAKRVRDYMAKRCSNI